jgi:hypothetical protein
LAPDRFKPCVEAQLELAQILLGGYVVVDRVEDLGSDPFCLLAIDIGIGQGIGQGKPVGQKRLRLALRIRKRGGRPMRNRPYRGAHPIRRSLRLPGSAWAAQPEFLTGPPRLFTHAAVGAELPTLAASARQRTGREFFAALCHPHRHLPRCPAAHGNELGTDSADFPRLRGYSVGFFALRSGRSRSPHAWDIPDLLNISNDLAGAAGGYRTYDLSLTKGVLYH